MRKRCEGDGDGCLLGFVCVCWESRRRLLTVSVGHKVNEYETVSVLGLSGTSGCIDCYL